MLKSTSEPLDAPKRPAVEIVHWLLVIAIGLVGLWQFHIPQFASNFDKFPGDRGDARLVAYLMEHWYGVFRGLASWQSPPMFYPVEGTIGYADLMLGYGIVYSGLRTLGLGIFEAAEFTIIISNFLNYFVCFVLLNKVFRFNLFASIAGAAFFAFNNAKLVQLGHLQLQPIAFLPLVIIGIVLLFQKRDRLSQKQAFGLIALSTISLALQLMTGFYSGWFFIFWSALFLILTLLFTPTRSLVFAQLKKFWPALVAAIGIFIVALIPFLMAYLPILRSAGGRPYSEIHDLIPFPSSFLIMGRRNYVWGDLSAIIQSEYSMSPELQIGIGLVPTIAWLALVVFAVWFVIKTLRGTRSFKLELLLLSQLIIATCLVYLLGTRYWHDFSPWQFVYYYVPGGQVIRGVARYVLVMALPMAIAFTFLIHVAIKRISLQTYSVRRTILFAALVVLTVFGLAEQFGRKEGFDGFSISSENQYLNRLAQSLPNDCSSFYVAVNPPLLRNQFEYQIDAIYVSILKGVPTLNGYSGQLPPNWQLWEVADPQYENNVKQWIHDHQIKGNVCRLFINEPKPLKNIADPEIFIRQQYQDILRREPDETGLQTWLAELNRSPAPVGGSNKNSSRVTVSIAILNSPEFLERSYFVLRLYLAALGRPPLLQEFVRDRDSIVSASAAELDGKKEALIDWWSQQFEFKSVYDGLGDDAFVRKLLTTAGNPSLKGVELVSALQSKQKTRAQVVRAVVDDQQTIRNFQNHAFVLMQFFAHLDRDPEPWEYQNRLRTLDATGDYRQLVFDILYSVEYRKRFGYVN